MAFVCLGLHAYVTLAGKDHLAAQDCATAIAVTLMANAHRVHPAFAAINGLEKAVIIPVALAVATVWAEASVFLELAIAVPNSPVLAVKMSFVSIIAAVEGGAMRPRNLANVI